MKTFFSDLISQSDCTSAETSRDLNTMVEEYLLVSCLPQEEDPLVFWKVNQGKFPSLARPVDIFLYLHPRHP